MASNAIFIGWGLAVRGREKKALQVFGEAVGDWTGLAQRGEIEGFETYALDPHGGELQGFLVAKGSEEQLCKLLNSEEFRTLNVRASFVVEDFGVVSSVTGEELQKTFGQVDSLIDELT